MLVLRFRTFFICEWFVQRNFFDLLRQLFDFLFKFFLWNFCWSLSSTARTRYFNGFKIAVALDLFPCFKSKRTFSDQISECLNFFSSILKISMHKKRKNNLTERLNITLYGGCLFLFELIVWFRTVTILSMCRVLFEILSYGLTVAYVKLNTEVVFYLGQINWMQIKTAMNLLLSDWETFKCADNLHDHLLKLNQRNELSLLLRVFNSDSSLDEFSKRYCRLWIPFLY